MSGELGTTNLLIGIMAAVSVLSLLIIVMGVAGFIDLSQGHGAGRRTGSPAGRAGDGARQRHPRRRQGSISEVKDGPSRRQRDPPTIDRVDGHRRSVRANVRAKTSRIVGFVRSMRVAIEGFLSTRQPTGT